LIDPVLAIGFAGASLAIALSPGASWMYVISSAVSQGGVAGRAAIAGNATGILGHAILAALGLSALVAYSADVYAAVRLLGAIYLIVLAVRTIRSQSPFVRQSGDTDRITISTIYRQGIVMNLLNPKVALLMVALLPQFISAESGPILLQVLILGAIHACIASIVLTGVATLSLRAAPILYHSPKLERSFRWLSGGVLFGLGARTTLDV
jgi:threonine/homoserine/homoserine lactone efflux protein